MRSAGEGKQASWEEAVDGETLPRPIGEGRGGVIAGVHR
jgi:hypothetical protein